MIDPSRTVHEWTELTGEDFAALRDRRVVALVCASPLEVHGPHLPVMADIREGDAMLVRTAEKLRERYPELVFLRLPPVWVAADVLPHKGSVRFTPGTLVRVLSEMGESLCLQGVRDIWVGNFHGGPRHFVAIEEAAHRVNRRHGGRMLSLFSLLIGRLTGGSSDLSGVLAERLGVPKAALEGDAHGGAVETSLLLHLAREHVSPRWKDLAQRSVEATLRARGKRPLQKGERPTLPELFRGFFLKWRYFEENTWAGEPRIASPEAGREIFELLTDHAAEAMTEVLDGRLPPAKWHSPLWPARRALLSERGFRLVDKLMSTRPRPV
ncbi:MAG: creatininase family protein [Polyangiales bacterium]